MFTTEHKLEIRGLICGKYGSEAACARAIGWPKQRINKITNGIKEPNVTELCELADALDVPISELARFFLAGWSPNGQLGESLRGIEKGV